METTKSEIGWYVTIENVVYPCVEVEVVDGKVMRGCAIINGVPTWVEYPQYSEE